MRKIANWKRAVPGLIILAVLLLSVAGGAAYAKYVTDAELKAAVTITAKLGQVRLIEHKANLNDDGSYTLGAEEVSKNEYTILPGVDIPKDPCVKITDKSAIQAYVFLEVLTNIQIDSNGLSYELTDDWVPIDDLTGVNGGKVYYYKNAIDNSFGENGTGTIPVLVDNQIVVSQHLKTATDQDGKSIYPSGSVYLNFYACMGQTDAGSTPAEVYNNLFKQNP